MIAPWSASIPVARPAAADVEGWRLPALDLTALLHWGVPLVDDLVEGVRFAALPGGYELATLNPGLPYTAVPGSGKVVLGSDDGDIVNSSVELWLRSRALVGEWLAASDVYRHYDNDASVEDTVIDELATVRDRIAELDPPAVGDDDHATHLWPATLDRWLC